jgi:hypothetical protein
MPDVARQMRERRRRALLMNLLMRHGILAAGGCYGNWAGVFMSPFHMLVSS